MSIGIRPPNTNYTRNVEATRHRSTLPPRAVKNLHLIGTNQVEHSSWRSAHALAVFYSANKTSYSDDGRL